MILAAKLMFFPEKFALFQIKCNFALEFMIYENVSH